MKKVLLSFLSLSLYSAILSMDSIPLALIHSPIMNDTWNDLDIIDLPVTRWAEFEELQKQATNSKVVGEMSTQPIKDNKPRDYQRLLTVAQREKVCWMVFAEKNEKLVGMAGAIAAERRTPLIAGGATILTDYAVQELEGLVSHRRMIAALLDKLKNAGIAHAEVRIPLKEKDTIKFYQEMGFAPLFSIESEISMQKILISEQE